MQTTFKLSLGKEEMLVGVGMRGGGVHTHSVPPPLGFIRSNGIQ